MRAATRPALALGLAAALVLLARSPLASAESLDPRGEDWEGLSELAALARGELGADRVVLSTTLDLHRLGPTDALLIVHPTRALDADELSAFMTAGGRILLLDDYGTGDGLLAHFGIRRVPLPGSPAAMLRANPELAIAEPAGHAAVRDAEHVVTNHATGLEKHDLSPVLVVRGATGPDVLVAVAGAVRRGRLLAVGDSSVAMNSMLRYPGNRALALDLLRYATEDDAWGARDGKLYVLVNDFDTTGSFGDDSPVTSALSDVRRAAASALEILRRGGTPPLACYVAALAVGLGVIAWTSARAGRTYKASVPRFVRAAPVVAQGGIAGRAAILGAPGTSPVLAMLEIKSALEEGLATRLGLERAPPHDELVAKAKAAALLDEDGARSLSLLFARLTRIETMFSAGRRSAVERVRDADVLAAAAQMRALLGTVDAARRGKVEGQ